MKRALNPLNSWNHCLGAVKESIPSKYSFYACDRTKGRCHFERFELKPFDATSFLFSYTPIVERIVGSFEAILNVFARKYPPPACQKYLKEERRQRAKFEGYIVMHAIKQASIVDKNHPESRCNC